MRKKMFGVLLAVITMFSFSSVVLAAPPQGTPIAVSNNTLPANQSLYLTHSYTSADAQWQSIYDNVKNTLTSIETLSVVGVVDLNVYDAVADAIIPAETYAGTQYTFDSSAVLPPLTTQIGSTVEVWVSNVSTGGWKLLGTDPANIVTANGFGTFAVTMKTPPLPISTIPTLPAGQTLHVQNTYDSTSAQWQGFDSYIQPKIVPAEFYSIETVVDVNAFDRSLNQYIASEAFAGTAYTFSLKDFVSNYGTDPNGRYEVYMYSTQTGSWQLISNDVESVTTNLGFGTFAVVKRSTPLVSEFVTNPNLPSAQSLRIGNSYNELQVQWSNFQDYVNTALAPADNKQVFAVVDMLAYDANLGQFLPAESTAGTTYWFSLVEVIPVYDQTNANYTYEVYLNNSVTGGWTYIGNTPNLVTTNSGFGTFAVLRVEGAPVPTPEPTPEPTPATSSTTATSPQTGVYVN